MKLFESEPIRLVLKKKPQGRSKAFMDEFWAETQRHPFMRPEDRILTFSDGDFVVITCDTRDDPHGVHISDMNALDSRGKGNGTRALRWLNDLADKHDVTLSGLSKSYMADPEKDPIEHDTTVLKQNDLTSWYVRHGYEAKKAEGGHKITRRPKPPTEP